MPFSPSDFEWWAWLLFAIGAAIVGSICWWIAVACFSKAKVQVFGGLLSGLIGFVAGLTAFGCFVIGVVRFVKWVWGS